jgi:hypothetical protein
MKLVGRPRRYTIRTYTFDDNVALSAATIIWTRSGQLSLQPPSKISATTSFEVLHLLAGYVPSMIVLVEAVMKTAVCVNK